jgi:hypothetical protein
MPYIKDDRSDKLPSQDQAIWRFLDLAKFIDILVNNSMWFACVQELVKDDPFEGAFPTAHVQVAVDSLRKKKELTELTDRQMLASESEFIERLPRSCQALRKSMYVNCWHASNYESAAMWSQYVRQDGLAIKSTVGRLIESFAEAVHDVRISEITYIDYETQGVDFARTYLYKRTSFEHEKELRAYVEDNILWIKSVYGSPLPEYAHREYAKGIKVNVSPKALIEEVRLAPTSQSFLDCVVKDVLAKYGLETVPVKKSAISEMPK